MSCCGAKAGKVRLGSVVSTHLSYRACIEITLKRISPYRLSNLNGEKSGRAVGSQNPAQNHQLLRGSVTSIWRCGERSNETSSEGTKKMMKAKKLLLMHEKLRTTSFFGLTGHHLVQPFLKISKAGPK